VLESHPSTLADKLPCVRVCVTPGCLRAVHVVEPETGRVRHEFTVRVEGGRMPQDVQLLITDKQRVLTGAVSVTSAGGLPLAVPVPAE
jgi:Sec-independent protein secretion pathway component TatC